MSGQLKEQQSAEARERLARFLCLITIMTQFDLLGKAEQSRLLRDVGEIVD